jgi:peptide/nickel transport system substrate-binding protein
MRCLRNESERINGCRWSKSSFSGEAEFQGQTLRRQTQLGKQETTKKQETSGTTKEKEEKTTGTTAPQIKDITVTVGFDQEPDTLDRHSASGTLVKWVTDPIYGFLITTDESGGVLEPAVAKEWKYNTDTELVFKLRDDVYFHNGRQLKADDIVFNLEYIANQENGSTLYNSIGTYIEKIEAPDDFTVKIQLKQPNASLLMELTQLPIMCKEAMDTMSTAPISCGPFKFVRWDKNQKIVFEAFEDFYIEGVPSYKNLVFNFYSDTSTCLTAYLANEIDIIHWVNQVDIDTILGTGDSYLYEGVASWRYLTGNQADPILSTPGVMEAISLAVDRQQIIDLVCAGYGEPAVIWMNESSPYYPKHLEYQRDIEKAKKLLADAGYPNGFEVELIAPNTASEGGAATVVQQQLKEIGIDVKLNILETPTFLERRKAKDYQLHICGSTLKADPYQMAKFYRTTASQNYSGFSNARYDELMEQAILVTDEDMRKEIFNEAFKIIVDEPVWISLFVEYKLVALKKNMKGFIYRPGLQDYTRLIIE